MRRTSLKPMEIVKKMKSNLHRLPGWTQEGIQDLRRRLERAESRMRDAEGRTKSHVWYAPGRGPEDCDDKVFLPDHESFVFELPTGSIHVHIRDGQLDVNSDRGGLIVLPAASNEVLVRSMTRDER